MKRIKEKIKIIYNSNRRLRRSLNSLNGDEDYSHDEDYSDDESLSSVILNSVSPDSKKLPLEGLKLDLPDVSNVKKNLRLDRLSVESSRRKSPLQCKIEEFLFSDENSIVVPDIKKAKKDFRYRLLSLSDLYQKFIVDVGENC